MPPPNSAVQIHDTNDVVASMRLCPFFRDFPDDLLHELARHAQHTERPAGYEILREGSINDRLYFLMEGSVGVYSAGELVIRMENEGDIIGEMSVLSRKPCNASVVAETSVSLLEVEAQKILDDPDSPGANSFQGKLFRIYSEILLKKLAATNERAKKFEEVSIHLKDAQKALIKANSELEQKVEARTGDLLKKTDELEHRNSELTASHHKLEELYNTKDLTVRKLNTLYTEHLLPLQATFGEFVKPEERGEANFLGQAARQVDGLVALLQPLSTYHASELAMKDKRVLLAESNPREQNLAKLALGGTGVTLEIVTDIKSAKRQIDRNAYDLLCTNREMIELTAYAKEKRPEMQMVFLTSDDIPTYIKGLRDYPFLTNIASRNPDDRGFTVKNMLTTVRKMMDSEIFGLEKYLFWGVDVIEHKVTGSVQRRQLIEQMTEHFANLGIRKKILEDVGVVAEELLMNAIYDAAVDEKGAPIYNHLPRTTEVKLKSNEQGTIRYACDGVLLGISVEDPFGSFERSTLLQYLENCYADSQKILDPKKGGAGKGLYLLIETADMVVFNVRAGQKTEGIALFHLDHQLAKQHKHPSFQFFHQDKF